MERLFGQPPAFKAMHLERYCRQSLRVFLPLAKSRPPTSRGDGSLSTRGDFDRPPFPLQTWNARMDNGGDKDRTSRAPRQTGFPLPFPMGPKPHGPHPGVAMFRTASGLQLPLPVTLATLRALRKDCAPDGLQPPLPATLATLRALRKDCASDGTSPTSRINGTRSRVKVSKPRFARSDGPSACETSC